MGGNMANIVDRTISVVGEKDIIVDKPKKNSQLQGTFTVNNISSANSLYLSDPDSLIHRYFLSSPPKQRVHLRKVIANTTKNFRSILKILDFSRQGDVVNAYDAGVDLLAEFDNLSLHDEVYQYLEAIGQLLNSSSTQKTVERFEDFWEILIKGISCAYRILAQDRLNLILKISQVSQRRVIKAAVIDALVTIADTNEIDNLNQIRNILGRYTSDYEPDSYIRSYAKEAVEDLG